MSHEIICSAGVLHFGDAEPGAGPMLLVFGNRRPSDALLNTLIAASRDGEARLSVVRVATIASALRQALGAPSPNADVAWAVDAASALGAVCEGEVLWDVSFAAGVVHAARRAAPRMACVVPSTQENSRSTRRALAVAGRLVEGQLAVVTET